MPSPAAPHITYQPFDPNSSLAEDVLAAVMFGEGPLPPHDDPRYISVRLKPLRGAGLMEVWRANGPVKTATAGAIRYAADAHYLFGVLEVDERERGGIAGAAEMAYAAIRAFVTASAHPHLLRVWNHFDDINGGEGDAERYRQFCVGRAAGLGDWHRENYPAATAIGRRDGDPMLQVYWLAGREPGVALANPRQVNPWSYPRAYGPTAPQFSRAMQVGGELVLISGTASIVGHASHHASNLRAQLDESLANLQSVLGAELSQENLLKIYLRDAQQVGPVEERLRERLPQSVRYLILAGDICRNDLLVEIECVRAFANAGDPATVGRVGGIVNLRTISG